jgi:hypothetical protein
MFGVAEVNTRVGEALERRPGDSVTDVRQVPPFWHGVVPVHSRTAGSEKKKEKKKIMTHEYSSKFFFYFNFFTAVNQNEMKLYKMES